MTTQLLFSRRSLLGHATAGLALAALASPRMARAIEPGQALPMAHVPGAAGQPAVPLYDGKARATYIDFWASWCGPCRQSFPWMGRMQSKFGPRGLRIVAVNLDAQVADAQRFLAQLPAPFTVAFDSAAESARRFGIKAMPSSVLLGADGKVIAVHAGFRDEDVGPLEARIAAALGTS
jgi:cytochrome c biogenesis protein CcmG/thiol:disulfide interchange protein DsbE